MSSKKHPKRGRSGRGGKRASQQLVCRACEMDDKRLPARGFCRDCGDYLCNRCFEVHTMVLPIKHHQLLELSDMPSAKGDIPCPNHPDRVVEFLCETHNQSFCGSCTLLQHRACECIEINPNVAIAADGAARSGLVGTLDRLDQRANKIQKEAATNVQHAIKSNKKALKDLQAFRDQINAHFEQMEHDLLSQAERMKDEDASLENARNECAAMKAELTEQKELLKKHEGNNSDLFVVSKQASKVMESLKDRLEKVTTQTRASRTRYRFQPNPVLQNFMDSNSSIGTIEGCRLEKDESPESSPPRNAIAALHRRMERTARKNVPVTYTFKPDKMLQDFLNSKAPLGVLERVPVSDDEEDQNQGVPQQQGATARNNGQLPQQEATVEGEGRSTQEGATAGNQGQPPQQKAKKMNESQLQGKTDGQQGDKVQKQDGDNNEGAGQGDN